MSLIHCPECAHEVATSASACPNCGRPLAPPVAERKVVVVDPPQSESFPTWALIPIGLLGVILIAVLFLLFNRSSEDANANIRVNANFSGSRPVARTEVPSTTTEVPSTSSAPVSMPPASQTTVPGSQATVNQPTKGKVTIAAKVVTANGKTQNVSNARFYLLDQDVETILSDARVEPIGGQTLSGSLGLSIVFPDRYGDFNRKAMAAINKHIKYSGRTGGSGTAGIDGVEPNSYYLFAMTKVGRGFSIWNSPVSVQVGDNMMTLSPQSVTEIQDPAG